MRRGRCESVCARGADSMVLVARSTSSLDAIMDARSPSFRRPPLVWLLVLIHGFLSAFVLIAGALALWFWPHLPESAKLQALAVPTSVDILMVVATMLQAAGTVQMFRMKRSAFLFFGCLVILLAVKSGLYLILTHTPPSSYFGLGMLEGYVLDLLTCWYTWSLGAKGVLK